ncbi:hypothetical protein KAZ66_05645 [Candidatus Woesebacteria bacterium]|nr:hypothetical protein [Candidatus Woesebacteria bacterium]
MERNYYIRDNKNSNAEIIRFGNFQVSPTYITKGNENPRGISYRTITDTSKKVASCKSEFLFAMCGTATQHPRYVVVENSFYNPGPEELFTARESRMEELGLRDKCELLTITDIVALLHQLNFEGDSLNAIVSQLSPYISFSLQPVYNTNMQLGIIRRYDSPQPSNVNYEAIFV